MDPASPRKPPAAAAPGHLFRVAAFAAASVVLVLWASPPSALVAGILFALGIGHPFQHWNRSVTKWLLQACVILLGFVMNLPVILRAGLSGSLFAALSIGCTLLLGRWLGRRFQLDGKTSWLISSGTAICGGSAIAAVSSVIGASESQIAVSIGTIFMLNALALWTFPPLGHFLHLTQAQFGLWAGVAIHDISSVVGAGISYGPAALTTATAVKLSRTLWIAPLTLAIAIASGREKARQGEGEDEARGRRRRARVAVPWFIGVFLLASLARSMIPGISYWSPWIEYVARRGMVLVLFLIGTSLALRALRAVGWRAVTAGLVLWVLVSAGSLLVIRLLNLSA